MITIQPITQEAYKNRFIYNATSQLLGEGGFAKVYEAFDTLHQRTVALKVFTGSDTTRYNLAREIQQMQQVPPHQNVVTYYEVLEVSTTGTDVHGNSLKQQIAVIEFANYQTLEELMKKQIPDVLRKELLTNILKGLFHLHQHNIIHRDLKPRNILIHNENGKLIPKITDFGIAKAITESDATATQTATGIIGTAAYLAPEQIAPEQFGENGKVNTKADIWSFGVIVYEWIAGKKLYAGNTTNSNAQIINAVLKGVNKEQIAILPQPYKSVVEKCLVQKAVERGNVVELVFTTNEAIREESLIDEPSVINNDRSFYAGMGNKDFYFISRFIGTIILLIVSFLIIINQSTCNRNNLTTKSVDGRSATHDSDSHFHEYDSSLQAVNKKDSHEILDYKNINYLYDADIFNQCYPSSNSFDENMMLKRNVERNNEYFKLRTKIKHKVYYKSNAQTKVVVLIYSYDFTDGEKKECHACYPELDIATFILNGKFYKLERLIKNSEIACGTWGEMAEMSIKKINDRLCLNTNYKNVQRGVSENITQYYDIETLKEVNVANKTM
jgi:serine/threonine protein kinase